MIVPFSLISTPARQEYVTKAEVRRRRSELGSVRLPPPTFGARSSKTRLYQAPVLHFQATVAHCRQFLIVGDDHEGLLEIPPQVEQQLV